MFETDDGWARERLRNRPDDTASIGDQRGFSREHQPDCSAGVANIDGFEVGVEYQYQRFHIVSRSGKLYCLLNNLVVLSR